jgi:hypothetical protein
MMNTVEKPRIYATVDIITFRRIPCVSSPVNSSRLKPVINVKYAGINGKIQGEKKDKSPAKKAA